MDRLMERLRRVRPDKIQSGNRFLPQDNAPSHTTTVVNHFLAKKSVTAPYQLLYSPDLTPADHILFSKVISNPN